MAGKGQLEGFELISGIFGFLEENSEKGRSRKSTGNRVARWITMFWGNLEILCCFAKRIVLGEFEMRIFWCFGRGLTWRD
jgi:hypothetical protein